MAFQAVRAPACAPLSDAVRAARVERALRRFLPEAAAPVRALASEHAWLADLAVSFPALLVALATPRASKRAAEGCRLVVAGAPLASIAAATGVPLWLRAFPPEAFSRSIPQLPDSAEFRRRIANHVPKVWRAAPDWLDHVSHAFVWGNEDIALWMAREVTNAKRARVRGGRRRRQVDFVRRVSLWAWYAQWPETMAGALAATKWHAEMGWESAVKAAHEWYEAVTLSLWLGGTGLDDVWLEPGVVDGYAFAPLRTASDVVAEAEAMRNCVRTYGSDLGANYYRLWSVWRDGERVATMSLSACYPSGPFAQISELSGVANAPVALDVWIAARRWLHAQDAPTADPKRIQEKGGDIDPKVWREAWRPFWLAKRRIPAWLPLTPKFDSLYML